MLEKPNIQDENIILTLQKEYGLLIETLTFLPIGADVNSAVYRAVSTDQTRYFLKLRSGQFDETSVILPQHYHNLGIIQDIFEYCKELLFSLHSTQNGDDRKQSLGYLISNFQPNNPISAAYYYESS
ncbi:MAG: hypothetical protein ACI9EW_001109 [Cellvibrionaceae bacterium]|jgi:hypothetical protein